MGRKILKDILDVLRLRVALQLELQLLSLRLLLDDFGLLDLVARSVPLSARAGATAGRAVWLEEEFVAGRRILGAATRVSPVERTLSFVDDLRLTLGRDDWLVVFVARALFDLHRFVKMEAIVVAVVVVEFRAAHWQPEARRRVDDLLIMA